MTLSLEYFDKYRLWSELVQANSDRVFIKTTQFPKIGALVPVQLVLPELSVQIVITGMVMGRRSRSERFASGVYIRFSDEEIDKCRRFLGLTQHPSRYEQGRKAERIDCSLPLHFRRPLVEQLCEVKNISATGILARCPAPLVLHQEVELMLTLDDGSNLPLSAEVSWAGGQSGMVGLHFLSVGFETEKLINKCLERLAAKRVMRGPSTVLIADDEPAILTFLDKALTRHGFSVHKASRGEQALELVRELRPALVMLDILMPGIDGVDICKTMRADVEMADIPVIFISALDPRRLHEVADEAGATDYLSKPVALSELINLVGTYLKA
jgi:CheY-like chemotaxis protein